MSIQSIQSLLKKSRSSEASGQSESLKVRDFEFVDFTPSPGVVRGALDRLSRIFGESPSDSSSRAILRRTVQGGFQGTLQIRSAVGTFVADVIGEDPLEVVNQLSSKILHQLREWKQARVLPQVN